ncbi:hypothetical protein P5G65_18060 [Paenibacillus chondroitinus]|uniref:Uncharacterized protein n=1 Tax=Paenibacillus chondroitinus TaxID=59842 RepID=A0ABU6DDG1_9BACL|nr:MULTISPECIES: hypothetical protein [Paenibacillus]MCY9662358.1 DUF4367 domain-containing protein [Paenibacillus anseongense]MEB4795809.1 hypothetical protein [Paenibacillus chondroitinus]
MPKKKWKPIAVSAIAVVSLAGALQMTTYAQDITKPFLAHFQVGNLEIKQYSKQYSDLEAIPAPSTADVASAASQSAISQRQAGTPSSLTIADARQALGVDFPVPAWLPEQYKYLNSVVQGAHAVELQYQQGNDLISLLISSGGQNGVSTTEDVNTEMIGGTKVYFTNGIVIWNYDGFTYELYQMAEHDLDHETIGSIIDSLATGKQYADSQAFFSGQAKAGQMSEADVEKAVLFSIKKDNQFKAAMGDNYEKVKSGELTRAQGQALLEEAEALQK